MKKLELESLSRSGGPKSTESNARFPKLPYFDEKTDQMDSYLTRLESYATACKWDPAMWAFYLSALLKGRALEVFVRLSKDDQSDYDQIREPLLNNFNLTERQLRGNLRKIGLKIWKTLGSSAVDRRVIWRSGWLWPKLKKLLKPFAIFWPVTSFLRLQIKICMFSYHSYHVKL